MYGTYHNLTPYMKHRRMMVGDVRFSVFELGLAISRNNQFTLPTGYYVFVGVHYVGDQLADHLPAFMHVFLSKCLRDRIFGSPLIRSIKMQVWRMPAKPRVEFLKPGMPEWSHEASDAYSKFNYAFIEWSQRRVTAANKSAYDVDAWSKAHPWLGDWQGRGVR